MSVQAVIATRFADRVEEVRRHWREQREVDRLGASLDFECQLELLRRLHAWARDAAAQLNAVYEAPLARLSDGLPTADAPCFTVTIGETDSLVLSVERRRSISAQWHIAAATVSGAPAMRTSLGSGRGAPWTRVRIENMLLAQLAAYERSLA